MYDHATSNYTADWHYWGFKGNYAYQQSVLNSRMFAANALKNLGAIELTSPVNSNDQKALIYIRDSVDPSTGAQKLDVYLDIIIEGERRSSILLGGADAQQQPQ